MSAKQHTMEVEMTDNNSGARSFSDQISALQTEVMKKSSMRLVGSQQSTMADLNDLDKKIEESTDSDSEHAHDAVNWTESLTWSLLVIQITFIILFGIFCKYSTELDGRDDLTTPEDQVKNFSSVYPMFQDVHIMMFIGFGYLMTFLRRYSYSAVGFNFVIAAIAIQWSMLTRDFFEQCWNSAFHKIELDVASMVNGDFCAAAVLISFGAVLGKTSLVQLVWMVIMEVVFYSVNEALIVKQFQASDVGGSMIIHTFGAYFGLTVSRMMASSHSLARKQNDNRAVYHSDVFAMIGTIFLWCYWPSFNGALAGFDSNAQPRTTLNTYLSLAACCLIAFAVSKLLRGGKLDMVDIQNATLAGGVAIGASANFMLRPWAALFVGTIAGFLSSFGFARVMKFLSDKIGLHDTCGVHNLHGMPGVLGGLVSIIATAAIEDHDYGNHIGAVYPARLDGRSHSAQAWFQLAALLSSIGIGIGGGIIAGFVLRSSLFEQVRTPFSDDVEWITPNEEVTFFDSKRQFQLKERKSAKSLKTSSSEDAMV